MLRFPGSGGMDVIVSSFCVNQLEDERSFFILINEVGQGELSHTRIFTVDAPSFVSVNVGGPRDSSSEEPHCRTIETLPNSMRFHVYRMILSGDDFTSRSALFRGRPLHVTK